MPKKKDIKVVEELKRGYTEEDLDRAVSATNDGGIPMREASRHYAVPYATLQRRCKEAKESNGLVSFKKPGPKPVLSEGIEAGLVEAIIAFERLGYGLGRVEIMSLAKEIDVKQGSGAFGEKDPSPMWYKRFSERNKLSLRIPRGLAKSRNEMSNEAVRDDLFGTYRRLLERYNFKPNVIYNMDESGLKIVCKPSKIVAKTGSKIVYSKQEGEQSENITVVTSANAIGTVIVPPMVIFKCGYLTTKIRPNHYPENTSFAVTDSGYMTSELFLQWFEIFLNNIPPVRPALLILDGHVSHVSVDFVEMAKKNDVHLLVLPPHTTHIWQPLDVGVFKSLKDKFKEQVRLRMRRCRRRGIKKYDFGKVFTPAYYASITAKNIRSGFRRTGLWPEDKYAADLSKFEESRRQSSPSLSSSTSTPSTSKNTASTSASTPSPSTQSIVPLEYDPPTQTITDVIKSYLASSPQKDGVPKRSRRITIARCLTNEELQTQIDILEKPVERVRLKVDNFFKINFF